MNATEGTIGAGHAPWPDMPYASWRETKETVHRFAQLVGKIRLAAAPRRNHWWNVTLHLTGRGLTTRPMGDEPIYTVDFDFLDHRLDATTVEGRRWSFPLTGQSVAGFTDELLQGLDAVGSGRGPPGRIPTARPCLFRGSGARDLRPGRRHPLLANSQPGQPPARGVGWDLMQEAAIDGGTDPYAR
jgi:hypothetical protein